MMNEQNMNLKQLERDNMKKLTDLNHFKAMEDISLQEFGIKAETDQRLAMIKADEQ
jgi:hypothetical protein